MNNDIISKNKTLKANNLINHPGRKKDRKQLLARSPQIIESHQRLVFEYNDITFHAEKHTHTHTFNSSFFIFFYFIFIVQQ